jgi:Protein of unknown function (DUF5818)
MKRIFLSLAGFVTLFILMAVPVQSAVLSTHTLQAQAQPEAETFMGTILKDGENYVLSDPATKSRYTLDDAKKAKLYEGKTVKVTGMLDKASNVIHVQTIQDIA